MKRDEKKELIEIASESKIEKERLDNYCMTQAVKIQKLKEIKIIWKPML